MLSPIAIGVNVNNTIVGDNDVLKLILPKFQKTKITKSKKLAKLKNFTKLFKS